MIFWIVQGLGIVSLILFAASLQMKTKEKVLMLKVFSYMSFAVQFLLQNAMTGAAAAVLAIARGSVFYIYTKRDMKPSKVVLAVFACLSVIFTVFTWQGMMSALPFIAMLSSLFGQWQNNLKLLRILSIFASALWVVYEFYAGLYTGMLAEIAIIISGIVALWRFRARK